MLQKFFIYNKRNIKLIDRLSKFTKSFIPPCDDQVSDADDLLWFHQRAPCYCGKVFCKTRWQIRMPYKDAMRAVHYNHNAPSLCSQYVSFLPFECSGAEWASAITPWNWGMQSKYSSLNVWNIRNIVIFLKSWNIANLLNKIINIT